MGNCLKKQEEGLFATSSKKDVEKVEWLNKILMRLWPFIGVYVKEVLQSSVTKTVNASLPGRLPVFQEFRFSEVELGDIPPRIEGVKVYEEVKKGEIYMDLELNFSSNAWLQMNINKSTAGIKDLQIFGNFRVVMKPLINRVPIIAGITLFFLNNPELHFDLTKLANVFDMPGIKEILNSIIIEQIANIIVLPDRFPITLSDRVDKNLLKYPPPQGVVRVNVMEAKNLIGKDWSVKGKKGKNSDPYVVIKLGAQKEVTKTIKKTLNPTWNETFELIVDVAFGQLLHFDVFDWDRGNKDDILGRAHADVDEIREKSEVDKWLTLEGGKSGKLHVNTTWLWLANERQELERNPLKGQGLHSAILTCFVHAATSLPKCQKRMMLLHEPSTRCIMTVGKKTEMTTLKPNTRDPVWDQKFRFLVMNPKTEQLKIELMDDTRMEKTLLGELSIDIKNLLVAENMVMDQDFKLKTEDPDSLVNMRLCLRILTQNANPKWLELETSLMKKASNIKQ